MISLVFFYFLLSDVIISGECKPQYQPNQQQQQQQQKTNLQFEKKWTRIEPRKSKFIIPFHEYTTIYRHNINLKSVCEFLLDYYENNYINLQMDLWNITNQRNFKYHDNYFINNIIKNEKSICNNFTVNEKTTLLMNNFGNTISRNSQTQWLFNYIYSMQKTRPALNVVNIDQKFLRKLLNVDILSLSEDIEMNHEEGDDLSLEYSFEGVNTRNIIFTQSRTIQQSSIIHHSHVVSYLLNILRDPQQMLTNQQISKVGSLLYTFLCQGNPPNVCLQQTLLLQNVSLINLKYSYFTSENKILNSFFVNIINKRFLINLKIMQRRTNLPQLNVNIRNFIENFNFTFHVDRVNKVLTKKKLEVLSSQQNGIFLVLFDTLKQYIADIYNSNSINRLNALLYNHDVKMKSFEEDFDNLGLQYNFSYHNILYLKYFSFHPIDNHFTYEFIFYAYNLGNINRQQTIGDELSFNLERLSNNTYKIFNVFQYGFINIKLLCSTTNTYKNNIYCNIAPVYSVRKLNDLTKYFSINFFNQTTFNFSSTIHTRINYNNLQSRVTLKTIYNNQPSNNSIRFIHTLNNTLLTTTNQPTIKVVNYILNTTVSSTMLFNHSTETLNKNIVSSVSSSNANTSFDPTFYINYSRELYNQNNNHSWNNNIHVRDIYTYLNITNVTYFNTNRDNLIPNRGYMARISLLSLIVSLMIIIIIIFGIYKYKTRKLEKRILDLKRLRDQNNYLDTYLRLDCDADEHIENCINSKRNSSGKVRSSREVPKLNGEFQECIELKNTS